MKVNQLIKEAQEMVYNFDNEFINEGFIIEFNEELVDDELKESISQLNESMEMLMEVGIPKRIENAKKIFKYKDLKRMRAIILKFLKQQLKKYNGKVEKPKFIAIIRYLSQTPKGGVVDRDFVDEMRNGNMNGHPVKYALYSYTRQDIETFEQNKKEKGERKKTFGPNVITVRINNDPENPITRNFDINKVIGAMIYKNGQSYGYIVDKVDEKLKEYIDRMAPALAKAKIAILDLGDMFGYNLGESNPSLKHNNIKEIKKYLQKRVYSPYSPMVKDNVNNSLEKNKQSALKRQVDLDEPIISFEENVRDNDIVIDIEIPIHHYLKKEHKIDMIRLTKKPPVNWDKSKSEWLAEEKLIRKEIKKIIDKWVGKNSDLGKIDLELGTGNGAGKIKGRIIIK
jgi:hypothetical protein